MAILLDCLRNRQTHLQELVNKGQYAQSASFAQDFAVVNKDCASPLAIYADSAAKLDKVSEREGISHWILSTENMDREGDCLIANGCLSEIEPFKKNPIVDYDHRRFHVLPIGKSVGDGNLPVIVTQNKQVVAGCKHHSETQFADEVARLVFKGLLNGCSVAFVPVVGERMTLKSYGGERTSVTPRYKFSKWQITAWSICPVGINPESTRMELSMGWMKSPELIKSLTPYAETPKVWSPGWSEPSEEAMKAFEDINKDAIGAIRFHKSKFADEAACQKWLFEKALDGSAIVTNEKSLDFLQSPGELDAKTDKVDDGVYVVYSKAFPPKKKKEPDEEEEKPQASKKPPFPGKKPMPGAKPKPGDKPAGKPTVPGDEGPDEDPEASDNPDDTKATDDEIEGRDEEQEEIPTDEESPDDDVIDDPQDPMQDPAAQQDVGMDQSGTPTYAGQAMIDVAKHMAAELEFYKQSLAAHDHDGLKALMMQAMRNCQRDYDQWMAGAKRLFPHMDFDSLAQIGLDDGDLANQDDALAGAEGADGGDLTQDPLKKSLNELSDEDWSLVAIQAALSL